MEERHFHSKKFVVATSSHLYFRHKWLPNEIRDIAVEFLVEEVRKIEDPKFANEVHRTDGHFDRSYEETTISNSDSGEYVGYLTR